MARFKVKAWLLQEPAPQHAVPQEFTADSYTIRALPGHDSGVLDLVPPTQDPISIKGVPGHFSRVEILTADDKLRETIIVEQGQLCRYPAPWYVVSAERLGQFGHRDVDELEAESVVFEPMKVTGEGTLRLTKPNKVLRVAADAYLRVRVTDPNGVQRVMEYSDGTVTIR